MFGVTKQIDMVDNSQRHGKFFPAIPDNHFSGIQSKKALPYRGKVTSVERRYGGFETGLVLLVDNF